ncbi:Ribose ABC transport system, permease protein RbsC [Rubellimicrobium mesophilum DSM 19309]|uniref:Ribose ABC transport system, permease protein RbsC n=1 Tax=Rubellimicrobium mesophilum DSM 19309 TaxID=442562 RepID=A0A017HUQ3_9RHOB|nr:Ribose ABC transport system, permease protein RbsC [Rubellimicrobium mesophilum DSM 19309]
MTAVSAPSREAPASGSTLLLLLRLRTFVALFLVFAVFAFAAPNFLTAENFLIMSKHVALNAFLAIGMTFVIITGGIDLSVGSIVGLCGMVAGWLVLNGLDLGFAWTIQFNTFEICLIVIAVGVGVGIVNGLLITQLNVAPFIATLGTLYVARGRRCCPRKGRPSRTSTGTPDYGSDTFRVLGAGNLLGIPVSIWLLIVVALAAGVCRAADAARTAHLRRGRQREGGGAVGRQGQPREDGRLHVLGLLRGARGAGHLLAAPGLAPRDRRDLRAQRHRGGGAGRDLHVRRAGQDRRHHRRRLRHRHPVGRARDDGRVVLLADGHQGPRHHRGRGRGPGPEQAPGPRGAAAAGGAGAVTRGRMARPRRAP